MGAADKKDTIEQVVFSLFLNQGYEGTSVRMICKKAEIDPPTLYNYFDSKKGLFLSIIKKLLDRFIEESKSYESLLHVLPPDMQLYSIFSANVNYALAHIDEMKFYFRYTLFCPKELAKEVHELQKNVYQMGYKTIYDILIECTQAGLIEVDAEIASVYFLIFLKNYIFNAVFENWQPSKGEMLELWKIFYKCRLKGKEVFDTTLEI